ncbi:unnamed protein product [Bursaphelenchus xylophilus]|uniref:(pine wood nematode) hypothetical protein n=1 Tax=Bursaphelenchus xylophilus TaxID=6326 RepID=A0A1I7SQS7_BURXY|nr:unnamed protein product [Bursaphelenchus xylophilus]CAG9110332.1 unnamed protein product [Bursaphelenchus xylophilus]
MSLESLSLDQYDLAALSEEDSDEELPTFGEKCIAAFRLALADLPDDSQLHCEVLNDKSDLITTEPVQGEMMSSYAGSQLPPKPPTPAKGGGASENATAALASPLHSDSPAVILRPAVPAKPNIDIVRYSMANVQDDLDDVLNELLELGNTLSGPAADQILYGINPIASSSSCHSQLNVHSTPTPANVMTSMNPQNAQKVINLQPSNCFDHLDGPVRQPTDLCASPDNDSAYGDSSSTEFSTGHRYRHSEFSSNDSYRGSLNTPSPTNQVSPKSSDSGTNEPQLTDDELKALKIKEALEKMKEAKRKKIYVKFFLEDGSTKGLLIDERWTVADTMKQLANKLGVFLTPEHAIVEEYPEMHIKRIYEDHEMVVENIEDWLADSKNKLYFIRRPDKYCFIHAPEQYLLTEKFEYDFPSPEAEWSPKNRQELLAKYTQNEGQVPELEGYLLLKADGKKSWKKHYFVLRASGLYYCPKGKMKSAKDLQSLMTVYNNQIYTCTDWRKKYKAPTPFGFAVKHPKIQVKTSKYIKYVCTEDEKTFRKWVTALRITKNTASVLQKNYQNIHEENKKQAPIHVDVQSSVHSMDFSRLNLNNSRPSSMNSGHNSSRISLASSRFGVNENVIQPSTSNTAFDQDDCGTIKRQPPHDPNSLFNGFRSPPLTLPPAPLRGSTGNSVRFSSSTSNSGENLNSISNNDGGDTDSDEEQFPPPPDFSVFRQSPAVPVIAPIQPVSVMMGQQNGINGTGYRPPIVLPSAISRPTGPKIPPPPPPKRSENTRLQSANPQHKQQMDLFTELQQATLRQKQRIEGN